MGWVEGWGGCAVEGHGLPFGPPSPMFTCSPSSRVLSAECTARMRNLEEAAARQSYTTAQLREAAEAALVPQAPADDATTPHDKKWVSGAGGHEWRNTQQGAPPLNPPPPGVGVMQRRPSTRARGCSSESSARCASARVTRTCSLAPMPCCARASTTTLTSPSLIKRCTCLYRVWGVG